MNLLFSLKKVPAIAYKVVSITNREYHSWRPFFSHWMGKSVYEVEEHLKGDTRIKPQYLALLHIQLPIGIVLVALFGYLKRGV